MTDSSHPPVAAALANWNGARYVERCLAALREQTHPLERIVVVDNGSTDGSDQWLEAQPGITLIRHAENQGYCRGYNRAISATDTPYVLTLNTDAYLDTDFVRACLECLVDDERCAVATGQFFEQATDQQIGGGFWLRRLIRMYPTPADDQVRQVFGVTGAAAVYRRQALEAVRIDDQIYDEAYFSYGEDIDLSWRLHNNGWHSMYTPGARAQHVGSGSLDGALRFFDKPVFFQRQVLRNRYLTVLKNATIRDAWHLIPAIFLGELILWPMLLLRQPWHFPALLKTPFEFACRFPRAWRWRREIQRRRDPAADSVQRWLRGW